MSKLEKKNLHQPDGTNQLQLMKVESFSVGDLKINKHTAEKGWQWSKHLKQIAGGESCQRQHLIYVLSGKMSAKMDDGQQLDFGSEDFGVIPPGHDGWNSGDGPLVWLEFLHE